MKINAGARNITTSNTFPASPRDARHAAFNVGLLELLWNNAGDLIPSGGSFSDTFVGANKILRKGTFDIDGDKGFESIEYTAVITLGDLIPKKHHPELANTVRHKSKVA
jgi:hypothetical protein